MVTLEMAKKYLRVDSADEDAYIQSLVITSTDMCKEIARVDEAVLANYQSLSQTAILYAVGYLYEHREDADHKALTETLKHLLFMIREESF